MFSIDNYMMKLTSLLKCHFRERLIYVGLQGSYLRGEETNDSDIDVMVIIDQLSVSDLDVYRSIIHSLDCSEKSCGFICSKADLANWNPMEICNLLHSTKDYYGTLRQWTPTYTQDDIRNFIKISVNNLYHEICHRHIHAVENRCSVKLAAAYKGVFFILQNIHYLQCGEFIQTKTALLEALQGIDRAVLQRSIDMNRGIVFDYLESFTLLFRWCQENINK